MMINPRHILSILLAACVAIVNGQDNNEGFTAAKCLAEAPTNVFTLIDNATRLDMLDYYHANLDHPSQNAMGGDCYVTAESPLSVTLQGGEGIKLQLFILNPESQMPIIGLIETVDTPIPDSKLYLYTKNWQRIKSDIGPKASLADWVKGGYNKKTDEIEDALPFILTSYEYDPETKEMTLTNNMGQYFLPSDTPKALSYIKDKIAYKWDGKKFKLVK